LHWEETDQGSGKLRGHVSEPLPFFLRHSFGSKN
jgi:hypothetical protein